MSTETLWHVIVLSNFARGYDKYARRYSKEAIPESTFPDHFFLLREAELPAGIRKAGGLLAKLGIAGDRLLALRTQVPTEDLRENTRTGIGRYVERAWICLDGVAWLDAAGNPVPAILEEVMAEALRLEHEPLHPFEALRPRSFSVLPVARGCQAACPFCFSDASASAEQDQARLDLELVRRQDHDQHLGLGEMPDEVGHGAEDGLAGGADDCIASFRDKAAEHRVQAIAADVLLLHPFADAAAHGRGERTFDRYQVFIDGIQSSLWQPLTRLIKSFLSGEHLLPFYLPFAIVRFFNRCIKYPN